VSATVEATIVTAAPNHGTSRPRWRSSPCLALRVKGEFTLHCAFGYRASCRAPRLFLRSAKMISSFSISSAII
jgi:hypothetical protein